MRFLLTAALAALCGLSPLSAQALELVPISREFRPSGAGAVQSYEVVNRDAHPVAVEISVVTRALDLEGSETSQSAEDEFLIYPPQIVVPAGARQTVRVTWLGNPTPEKELAYRLVVEQVSIARYKPKAAGGAPVVGAVEVLLNYRGSLYVRPEGSRPSLALESTQVDRSSPARPTLAVTLHNRGSARAVLKEYRLQVKRRGEGPAVSIDLDSVKLKSSVVLADGRRRLVFPWPHGFEPGEVSVLPARRP